MHPVVNQSAIIRPDPPHPATEKSLIKTDEYKGEIHSAIKNIYIKIPLLSRRLPDRDFRSIVLKCLSALFYFFRAHPATPINTPPRRIIVPGPEPWAAIRPPPLWRAPPEEVGIMETMKRSRRKKMTNPDIFLEKDDFNGTSGNSRAYISSFVNQQHTCQLVDSRPAFISACIFKGMIPY
jgi:hypothetical protein